MEQHKPCNTVDPSQCDMNVVNEIYVILDGSDTILDSRLRVDYWQRMIDISKELIMRMRTANTLAHFVVPKTNKRQRKDPIPYEVIISGTLCADVVKMHNKLERAKNYRHVPGGLQDLQPTVDFIADTLDAKTGFIITMSGPYVPSLVDTKASVLVYYDSHYIRPDEIKNIYVDELFTDEVKLIDKVISLVYFAPGR